LADRIGVDKQFLGNLLHPLLRAEIAVPILKRAALTLWQDTKITVVRAVINDRHTRAA
jgi:hypothetical protein